MTCPDCGGTSVWDDDVCSSICTKCGTLSDSAQYVLASHTESHDSFVRQFQPGSWLSSSAAPLKNIHKHGWNLAGQHKEARDRRNAIAMSIFINSVLTKLKNPGLSPRAEAIFTQAMTKGKYRWGRKAKLAAGASMAIALREAHKSDSLRDIAFFLDDSPLSMSRAFVAVVSLLDFDLSSPDSIVHLPILWAHLQSLLHPETVSSTSHLPQDLVAILTPLSSHAVLRTATSLSGIINREACATHVLQSPTPPIACAMLILALEAETRNPLPHLSELANALASRFGFARGVVTSRYKACYDLIEEWIREVPWLDQFVYKGKGRGASARSKVPKRSIVAKGIMDVIQFQEEIWTKKMTALGKASIVIEADPTEEDSNKDDGAFFSETSSITEPPELCHHPPRKKRKTSSVEDAYHFLLDPLSAKSYTLSNPMVSEDPGASTTRSDTSSPILSPPSVPFTTHLLSTSSYDSKRSPSRLQLLALSRGGGSAEHIHDDELFVAGELEGLLRSHEEQEALKPLFRLQWQEDADTVALHANRGPETARMEVSRGSGRVDMEALARILGGEEVFDDKEHEAESESSAPTTPRHVQSDAAEEVSAWRPLSPGDAFTRHCTSMDRYEEEY
ncbi:hypothetical protein DEU56DRAFT_921928 [Suillus clintonianus]|uniref:uncharacterized protein n=1 Tax=Suillus clintonianus TaxID=1904413 RepID=UPI001B886CD9|nr:uncharacterized protein DEU56DRAFT_921928 [Suillus clintonianus]KAG2157391.1 hypothetical protein DEU56DRAFT_921928 [Suillus clintonianus]